MYWYKNNINFPKYETLNFTIYTKFNDYNTNLLDLIRHTL